MSIIYTVGDATRTQMAQRADGVWFVRKKWKGKWGKWQQHGPRPFDHGMYKAPGYGRAELPNETETLLHPGDARCPD